MNVRLASARVGGPGESHPQRECVRAAVTGVGRLSRLGGWEKVSQTRFHICASSSVIA